MTAGFWLCGQILYYSRCKHINGNCHSVSMSQHQIGRAWCTFFSKAEHIQGVHPSLFCQWWTQETWCVSTPHSTMCMGLLQDTMSPPSQCSTNPCFGRHLLKIIHCQCEREREHERENVQLHALYCDVDARNMDSLVQVPVDHANSASVTTCMRTGWQITKMIQTPNRSNIPCQSCSSPLIECSFKNYLTTRSSWSHCLTGNWTLILKHLKALTFGKCIQLNFFTYVWIGQLINIFNVIMQSGKIPDEWRESTITPIYKYKGDHMNCSNYRGIKLLSHTMKLWERIIDQRLRDIVSISDGQFGFKSGVGTTDAIFVIRTLCEKYR